MKILTTRLIVAALVIAGLVAGWYGYSNFFAHKEITIMRTSKGFVPQKILIHKGDTVIFKSETPEPFWPSSDSHPTHGTYPEFDPKQPIAPNDSWSFTFSRAGVWGFHDHLSSGFTGTIIVQGFFGEAREACLANKTADDLAPLCWEADVTDVLSKKGLTAAFDYIDTLYKSDPRFQKNCHDVMHVLGYAAYKKFEVDHSVIDLPQTSYCGYGFYHGFIETMLVENGPSRYDEVVNYCKELDEKHGGIASGPCVHGIGHAIFDSLDGSLWGNAENMVHTGLAECERAVQEKGDREQCSSGIFNSFANAMSAGSYTLSFDGFDPVAFCDALPELYQQSCYGETGIGYIRDRHLSREDSLVFLDSLRSSIRPFEYFVYFADETKRAMTGGAFPMSDFSQSCSSLRHVESQHECIRGAIEGFREEVPGGKSYEYTFPFCSSYSVGTALRKYCGEQIQALTQTSDIESPGFQSACKSFTGDSSVGCMLK